MSGYRTVWFSLVAVMGALGVAVAFLTLPIWTLVAVALFSAVMGCAVCPLIQHHLGTWPPRPQQFATAASVAAAGSLILMGLGGLLGPGTIALVVLLAATSPSAARWYAAQREGPRERAGATTEPAVPGDVRPSRIPTAPPAHVPLDARSLSDEELCLAWRTSFTALQRTPDATSRTRLASARRDYLDEIERRHPIGFKRWISAGARAASDPSRYLTGCGNGDETRRPGGVPRQLGRSDSPGVEDR